MQSIPTRSNDTFGRNRVLSLISIKEIER